MKLHLKQVGKSKAARNIAVVALCAAIMIMVQVALSSLPNVELVSLLVILFTLAFEKRVFYIIYVFVFVEGLLYGYHIWWLSYLYIWAILAIASLFLRRMQSPVGWAVVSGAFGLLFGALSAIPYLFIGGWQTAFAYWVGGIPFDLVHCAANFLIALLLFRPLNSVFKHYGNARRANGGASEIAPEKETKERT